MSISKLKLDTVSPEETYENQKLCKLQLLKLRLPLYIQPVYIQPVISIHIFLGPIIHHSYDVSIRFIH